jgi:hypothetical protein
VISVDQRSRLSFSPLLRVTPPPPNGIPSSSRGSEYAASTASAFSNSAAYVTLPTSCRLRHVGHFPRVLIRLDSAGPSRDGFRAIGTIVAGYCIWMLTYQDWQATGRVAGEMRPNLFLRRVELWPCGTLM